MKLFKEAVRRGLIGILMGLFLSHTLFFIAALGKDMISVQASTYISQYLTYGIFGFYFSAVSIIFNMKTSISKRFLAHIVFTLPFLPIAYFIGFMPNNTFGIISFTSFYVIGYLISIILYKNHLRKTMA